MRCNNCGWDNPEGSQKCEKCNAPLQGGVVSSQKIEAHSTIREDDVFNVPNHPKTIIEPTIIEPQEPQNNPSNQNQAAPTDYSATINPYDGMGGYTPIRHCMLQPVIFPGEDMRDVPKPINLKGDYNELNRQLLDPDNHTITSKVQATLTCKDGKWYIQNQSVQKTTYVLAEEPVQLKSGDIILMGNRTFVFNED